MRRRGWMKRVRLALAVGMAALFTLSPSAAFADGPTDPQCHQALVDFAVGMSQYWPFREEGDPLPPWEPIRYKYVTTYCL
jgi:hypothetical protein